MLEIFFCNVGDGDAAIITETQDGKPVYTMLVDAGRPYLEPRQGSLRKEAIYHLKTRSVAHLDRMLLTHLHIDHIGGAQRILEAVPTDRLSLLTLPPQDAEWITPDPLSVDKPTNGLCYALNILRDLVQRAARIGCTVEEIPDGKQRLTDRLLLTVYHPRMKVIGQQRAVFDELYRQKPVPYEDVYRVSKARNLSSLMLRLTYAGKSVLITGDRYAADWEDAGLPPCDILKLPHHGDPKSMTEKLLKSLHPGYAVISCQNDQNQKKDRPNAEIIELLQAYVPKVLCTENREMPTMPAATNNGVRFTISDDGEIACSVE